MLSVWPNPIDHTSGTTAVTDASGEKVGWVFKAPRTGSIDRVQVVPVLVNTAVNCDVRLETVDGTTGNPSGTLLATNTNGTLASGSLVNAVPVEVTLTASAAVTRGQDIALVVAPTGTPDLQWYMAVGGNQIMSTPYMLSDTGGAGWTKFSATGTHAFAVRYTDGTWEVVMPGTSAMPISQPTLASNTTPDEIGMKLIPDADIDLHGIWLVSDHSGDPDVVLYDGSDNVLDTFTQDSNNRRNFGTLGLAYFWWPSGPHSLVAGETYRITVKPSQTTTVSMYQMPFATVAEAGSYKGSTSWGRTQRTDGGSWDDSLARIVVMMGLIFEPTATGMSEVTDSDLVVPWPLPIDPSSGNAETTDAAGEKVGFVFRAPRSGTIDRVAVRVNSAGTPVDVDVRLESVTAGLPSGSLFGTNTNATLASANVTASQTREVTLTAGAVVSKGDLVALVLAPTGTPNISWFTRAGSSGIHMPYVVTDQGGAGWAKDTASGVLTFGVRYSDGTYAHVPPGILPASINSSAVDVDSTPDEAGLLFVPDANIRAAGFWVVHSMAGDADVVLYDSANAVLASRHLDADDRGGTGYSPQFHLFNTPVRLVAGETYRLVVKPTTTTALNIGWLAGTGTTAAMLPGLSGLATAYWTQRTNAGAWTDTDTRFPSMGLLIHPASRAGSPHPYTPFAQGMQAL